MKIFLIISSLIALIIGAIYGGNLLFEKGKQEFKEWSQEREKSQSDKKDNWGDSSRRIRESVHEDLIKTRKELQENNAALLKRQNDQIDEAEKKLYEGRNQILDEQEKKYMQKQR